MEDLKGFYEANLSPSVARMHVVGAISQASILGSLNTVIERWENKEVVIPDSPIPNIPKQSKVYFYDVPNAKQSVLRIGYPALAATDKDYYPATITNYILGGGGFASQLTQQLREGKGYTYGIRSGFTGSNDIGTFTIGGGVRSNVTLESAQLVKQILMDYGTNYTEKDLKTTKGFLIKSNARAFETAEAKLRMLQNISAYGWDYDYVKSREAIVREMSIEQIKELSQQYLDANKMYWLVVGDAKTQLARMEELGFGKPVLINDISDLEK
jgi:zinc protease